MSAAVETAARGRFNDGRTAGTVPVDVTLTSEALEIAAADGRKWRWPLDKVRRVPEEGTESGLRLNCASEADARLTMADAALLAQLRRLCRNLDGRQAGAGARLRLAGSVIGVLALLVAAYFGLPTLAAALAPVIPEAWQQGLGARVEKALAAAFSSSDGGGHYCAADSGTAALGELVARLAPAAALSRAPHVAVLDVPLVNAFALPGNRIVLTRGLIDFALTSDELAGVLAHELGHLRHGDPLASLIARLEWNTVTTLVFGNGGVANFGEAVVLMSYSRRVEARADESGIDSLRRAGMDSAGFAAIMRRMGAKQGNALSYLQSHPQTDERVAAIERLGGAGEPALPQPRWLDLKRICTALRPL